MPPMCSKILSYPALEQWGAPRYISEFEYLYDELMKYVEEHMELKT